MEYRAIQKNITSSPRKLRLVADMIRKMDPYRAVELLQFTNKAAAQPLKKAILTAIANAGKKDVLGFVKIEINEAAKLKRYRAGTAGRGRGRPYKKRWSHIKIVLTDDLEEGAKGAKGTEGMEGTKAIEVEEKNKLKGIDRENKDKNKDAAVLEEKELKMDQKGKKQ